MSATRLSELPIAIAPSLSRTRLAGPPSQGAVPRHRHHRRVGLTVLPALLSLGLGLWGIRREGSIWRDEVVTYDMAHRSLAELRDTVANVDLVHAVYYLLLHGLFRVFDQVDPLLVMRLPSVAATVAATAGTTLLGRRLGGLRTGLLTGVLFALVPQVQRFAQEGRSYALVTACVVWATYLLIHAVRSRSAWTWAGYAALTLAAALLHEFAVLAVVAHAWVVPREARRRWAVAVLTACAGVAPLTLLSMGQSAQVSWIGVDVGGLAWFVSAGTVSVLCARWLLRHTAEPETEAARETAADSGSASVFGPGPGSRFGPGLDHDGVRLLVRTALPLAVLPSLILLLASILHPLFVDRYVLYSIAGQALLAGAALDRGLRGRPLRGPALLAAALAILMIPTYSWELRAPDSRRDDATAIAHAVQRLEAPGDSVLYTPSRRRVWSLTSPGTFAGLRDIALDKAPARSGWLYGTEVSAATLRARMLQERRIIVLRDPEGQPLDDTAEEQVKQNVLSRSFEECRTLRPQGARVSLYARPGQC
ncbi:hypothetical protein ACIOWG_14955 [Streptomyces sp. NPDC087658]|uniref:hypothetical protein n=1 Tax=Streptomyces sp. NPDC087658 TaxID=3365800 RepID=UPI0037FAF51D